MLITVSTYTNALEAHIVKGRMEADDIPAFIPHEHHIWAYWLFSNVLGGVRLQVLPQHVVEAKKILNGINNSTYENILEAQEGAFDKIVCPECNSDRAVVRGWDQRIALVVASTFSIPTPYRLDSCWCLDCGYRWRNKSWKRPSLLLLAASLPLFSVYFIYKATKSFLHWYRWKDFDDDN